MNSKQIIDFIKQPNKLQKPEAEELQRVLDEYPYSGIVHALYLKALKNQNNYLYPKQLKRTAIAVPDRKQLYYWAEGQQEAPEREVPRIIFKVQSEVAQPQPRVHEREKPAPTSPQYEPVPVQQAPIAKTEQPPAIPPKAVEIPEAKPTSVADINLDHLPPSVRETILRARRVHELYGKKYDTKPTPEEAPEVQSSHEISSPQEQPEAQPAEVVDVVPLPTVHQVPEQEKVERAPTVREQEQPKALHQEQQVEEEHTTAEPKEMADNAEQAPQADEMGATKLSFTDWLSGGSLHTPAETATPNAKQQTHEPQIEEEQPSTEKVQQLYAQFMEKKAKPSSTPADKDPIDTASLGTSDYAQYITETLAQVYVKQKLFDRAIHAYEILRLKYPEKSSFFAARITEIKHLRNENNSRWLCYSPS